MNATTISVRQLRAEEAYACNTALCDVLIDCVHGGASVSFMAPLAGSKAQAFWRGVADGVARGDRVLIVAEDEARTIVGTVQLVFAQPENQPHRADIVKMLVHRRARRRGIGVMLMQAGEAAALAAGRTVLVLDTATGSDAERLYQRMGWQRVGVVPDYALWPDGRMCATTYYTKAIA
jgi:GNAT superfamily N-acetyltransferase